MLANVQNTLQNILYLPFLIALMMSVYYSIKFRRERNIDQRGLFKAKQNICMGITMVLLTPYPLWFEGGSSIGIIIGALFLLIGLFNLFAGIRNLSIYRSRLTKTGR